MKLIDDELGIMEGIKSWNNWFGMASKMHLMFGGEKCYN